jgi:hypothetical protein
VLDVCPFQERAFRACPPLFPTNKKAASNRKNRKEHERKEQSSNTELKLILWKYGNANQRPFTIL